MGDSSSLQPVASPPLRTGLYARCVPHRNQRHLLPARRLSFWSPAVGPARMLTSHRMKYIYLDHNATTPLHPDVLAAMLPFFAEKFANPASITHPPGREARDMVEQARGEIAAFIGAEPAEIVFTSG